MSILSDSYTPAVVLHTLCLKRFGAEYLNWEPETIQLELEDDNVPNINLEKLQAVSTILTTEQFYTYWEPFQAICSVLSGDDPYFMNNVPCDPFQVAWGIIEAAMIDGDDSKYSSEVEGYIRTVFKAHGVVKTPQLLTKYVLPNYDMSENCTKEQIAVNAEYEHELNEYLKKRLLVVKEQLD